MNEIEKEEYRLAALAAGYEIRFMKEKDGGNAVIKRGGIFGVWRPKDWANDCIGLLVSARLEVGISERDGEAFAFSPDDIMTPVVTVAGTSDASAMLAIFRCAVAKGRSIEERK